MLSQSNLTGGGQILLFAGGHSNIRDGVVASVPPAAVPPTPASDAPMARLALNGVALLGIAGRSPQHLAADTYLAYLPQDRAISSERLARIVIRCANRPGTQERLTHDLGDILNALLDPHGVAVLIDTPHPNWSRPNSTDNAPRLITSRLLGAFQDAERRAAFFGWTSRRQRPGSQPCT